MSGCAAHTTTYDEEPFYSSCSFLIFQEPNREAICVDASFHRKWFLLFWSPEDYVSELTPSLSRLYWVFFLHWLMDQTEWTCRHKRLDEILCAALHERVRNRLWRQLVFVKLALGLGMLLGIEFWFPCGFLCVPCCSNIRNIINYFKNLKFCVSLVSWGWNYSRTPLEVWIMQFSVNCICVYTKLPVSDLFVNLNL